jgi:hypothetical protein
VIIKEPKVKVEGSRGIPAVSIRQPQATAVLAQSGVFRHPGWRTDYRGPLLIHAAKRLAGDPPAGKTASPTYGALLGVVDLTDCVANGRADGGPDEVGYVWVFANPRLFAHPISYIGRMGLFEVAHTVVADAIADLGTVRKR